MENETMNQQTQPTYDQVAQAYNVLARDFENLKMELTALRTDKLVEKLTLLLNVVKDKDAYSKKIVSLAEWNIEQMLAKSKN